MQLRNNRKLLYSKKPPVKRRLFCKQHKEVPLQQAAKNAHCTQADTCYRTISRWRPSNAFPFHTSTHSTPLPYDALSGMSC